MRFIDEALIQIHAGHGGPGCVSFRREKYVPRGGPDGGEGGKGGDILFKANKQLSTLQDFRFKKLYKAPNGNPGEGNNMSGRSGLTLEVQVPVGTVMTDQTTNEKLFDFTQDGECWLACRGGRGGKGNAHFVSSTFQAPKFAQPGEEGESLHLRMELKLLADAGIIGFPNAGKSTLISRISAARPKIADYPFTTLVPNLGVVSLPEGKSAVVADIPGLIQNAHKGHGLGHQFLRHIERCRVFIHLLDGTLLLEKASDPWLEMQGKDPFDSAIQAMALQYKIIRNELEEYNPSLLEKPEIVVLNKTDILNTELVTRAVEKLKEISPEAICHLAVSAVSGSEINRLLGKLKETLEVSLQREDSVRPGLKLGELEIASQPQLPDSPEIRS